MLNDVERKFRLRLIYSYRVFYSFVDTQISSTEQAQWKNSKQLRDIKHDLDLDQRVFHAPSFSLEHLGLHN